MPPPAVPIIYASTARRALSFVIRVRRIVGEAVRIIYVRQREAIRFVRRPCDGHESARCAKIEKVTERISRVILTVKVRCAALELVVRRASALGAIIY